MRWRVCAGVPGDGSGVPAGQRVGPRTRSPATSGGEMTPRVVCDVPGSGLGTQLGAEFMTAVPSRAFVVETQPPVRQLDG